MRPPDLYPAAPATPALPPPAARRAGLERAIGRFVVRRYRWCVLLVLAVMAGNVFLRLSSTHISDSDEARYGVSAYEMLQSRSFLVTTYARQPEYWNLKPPLGYWLIALSYRLFGYSSFALRLPSALFGLLVVAGTMAFAKRWGNRRLAVLSGLVVATAFGFLSNHGARSGDLDAALTFLLLLAAMQLPHLARSPHRRWRLPAFAAILACSFLLKSFAILPMIVVAAAWAVWSGAWRRLKPLDCALSALLFTVVVAAWALARWRADGTAYFLERMLREDLFLRSTQIIDKVTYSPFGYVTAFFDRFAPWPLTFLAAGWMALRRRRARRSPLARRLSRGVLPLLLLWTLVPLALFSLSRTQHHWYLHPIYPAAAMLAAFSVLALLRAVPAPRRTAALAGMVLLPLFLCEARIAYRVIALERMTPEQRFLARLRHHHGQHRRELIAGFPLQHSERFLLEVVDGFEVRDSADGPPTPGLAPRAGDMIFGKLAPGVPDPWRSPGRGARLIAEDGGYAVYRSAEGEALTGPYPRPVPALRTAKTAGLGPRRRAGGVGRGFGARAVHRLGRPWAGDFARRPAPAEPALFDTPHPGLARGAPPAGEPRPALAPAGGDEVPEEMDEAPTPVLPSAPTAALAPPEPREWPGLGPFPEEDRPPALAGATASPHPLERPASAGALPSAASLPRALTPPDCTGAEEECDLPSLPAAPSSRVVWDDGR